MNWLRTLALFAWIILSLSARAATVADDFTGNTPPAEPAGWTKVNHGTWTFPTASGGSDVIAQDQANGAGSRPHYFAHTATGSVSGAGQVLEVVVKWRYRSGETVANSVHQATLLLQALDGSTLAGYGFGPVDATTCRAHLLSSTGGANSLGGVGAQSIGFTLVADAWYWTRFRRETDGNFKGRIWADGSAEPSTWQWESVSANTTYTSGHLAFGANLHNAELDFDYVSLGLGEAAPTPGGGVASGLLLRRRRAANEDTYQAPPLRAAVGM